MAKNLVYEKILTILEEFVTVQDIRPEARLKEDLGLDSMELVRLILELNQAFGIQIKSTEMIPQHFADIESVRLLITQKQEI